jgi:hypothetical protein
MWQLDRHHMLHMCFDNIQKGDIVSVEHGWVRTFALLPHRTINGQYVWLKTVYRRRVWVYTGFIDEPETQYGELFDILINEN